VGRGSLSVMSSNITQRDHTGLHPEERVCLTWPPMNSVISAARLASPRERIKYKWRMLTSNPFRAAFLENLKMHPEWCRLFEQQPRYFHVPLSRFLDRRWPTQRRFECCATDLEIAALKFGAIARSRLTLGQEVRVCNQAFFSVDLRLNSSNPQEGYWAFTLKDENDTPVFNLSFGFLSNDTVLIASVQGAPGAGDERLEAIQSLTKHAHGLRPPHLLIAIFQEACKCWGVSELRGIDPKHHIKGRWNQRAKRLKFDYRALWQEVGAVRSPEGHWLLPSTARRRDAEDIPSRKRSQYRRRYAFMDALAAYVVTGLILCTAAPAPSEPDLGEEHESELCSYQSRLRAGSD
jgi:uncharacterized protein VirK/YbjX